VVEPSPRPAARGFTLVETLIAATVLGLILSAVYGSYWAVTSSIAGLEPKIALDQQGRFFVQRLSRQIRCCYGGPLDRIKRTSSDPNGAKPAAPAKKDAAEEMHFFRGGSLLPDGIVLQFVTTSSSLSRKSSPGCLALVSYKMDTGQHALLVCEELYGRRGEDADKEWRVIQEDLEEIEFRYFDGTDWQDQWDSRPAGGLPRAVRIKLVLRPEQDSASRCFTAVAALRCGAPRNLEPEVPVLSTTEKGPENPIREKDREK
jgi:prepilin-type N-terminal cleavage/methylation domain-containing protein